jgi:ubiquinone/menaquinone biosynthesis C-methylase UbiE
MPAKRRTATKKRPAAPRGAPAPRKRPAAKRRAHPAGREQAGHAHGAHGQAGGKRDAHGNPADFDAYVARLDDPSRDQWQRTDRVVSALGLRKGGSAADIGSGPGHFAIRMARKVGAEGRVYAIDVEPRMLDLLAERAAAAKAYGLVGLLSPEGDALPPEPVDVILMVNVFHHVRSPRYLKALATRLTPGGRIAIVDFHDRELPIGPPPEHKLSRAETLAAVAKAGLRVVREEKFLPYQYFLLVGPAAPKRARR